MSSLTKKSKMEIEERVAHIVWAAHILSYLTKTRNNVELQQNSCDDDEEELDCNELDAATERTSILQCSSTSIRSKFLDCLAQLLSPSKDERSVVATSLREREDFVEIDVARNDCFGLTAGSLSNEHGYGFEAVEEEYYNSLRAYISTGVESDTTALSEFECFAIAYTSPRVDYWVKELRDILSSASLSQNEKGQSSSQGQVEEKIWANFTRLLSQYHTRTIILKHRIVQRAYECVMNLEIHNFLHVVFEPAVGSKLWRALKFLTRPLIDIRILRDIATHHPQFQDIRISPVFPSAKTSIGLQYQIPVSTAWTKLTNDSPPAAILRKLDRYNDEFKEDCAKSYNLHAEIQLVMHYENSRDLVPTFEYFGCSKKTCLICEGFLQSLPVPICTRGRHGICDSSWGVLLSTSVGVDTALKGLETILISRINAFLEDPSEIHKSLFVSNVEQSTLASELSESTRESLKQREELIEGLKKSQMNQREENAILGGKRLYTQPGKKENLESHDSCVMCNKRPARVCGRCHGCYYCSKACQKSDWSSHKLLCKKFSVQGDRPSEQHRRAILFPDNSANPQMIWIRCERKYLSDDGYGEESYEELHVHPHLGQDRPFPGVLRIEHNPVRDRNLGSGMVFCHPRKEGYSIALHHRETFLLDGSAINRSILSSVGASGTVGHSWKGPMIAIRETASEMHEDITLGDFRHIIDWLISYGTTQSPESVDCSENDISTAVRGVKICCYGETKLHGSKPYISVDVPKGHMAHPGMKYREGSISTISELLGLPIRLWKCKDIDFWRDPPAWNESLSASSNQSVAFMMMGTNPKDAEIDICCMNPVNSPWGWAPLYWSSDLGNVLATREDGKDLAVDDVKMMCEFARRKLQPLFEDSLGGGFVSRTKQEVLDFITWENMVKFSNEMAEESEDS
ncbi:hypothetical protein OCU04_011639 [Sclerotinia nivalis]|uniref:MYND-type domain-containing protein n=1 Tax=Sclerotinia nivalis TaxID=352851 RepID=A0A9X0AFN7_9HELO|nr:hypothetical protein OCU04_011639 [Sclerotinia nivalis]